MAIFAKKKKQVNQETVEAMSKAHFEDIIDSADANVKVLADYLIVDRPVILNCEKLGVSDANKVIAFLSGITYALLGKVIPINRQVYLFASKKCFDDSSIDEFIKTI